MEIKVEKEKNDGLERKGKERRKRKSKKLQGNTGRRTRWRKKFIEGGRGGERNRKGDKADEIKQGREEKV